MLLPPAERSVGELGCLPAVSKLVVSSGHHPVFQRLGHPGYHHIAQPLLIEGLDKVPVVESSIEPDTGTGGSDRGGKFLDYALQEIPCPSGGMHIARPQLHPETQASSAFAGDDGGVGTLAVASFRDVAHGGAFLRTVRDQGCGIGVHNGAVQKAQTGEEFSSEFVVGCLETSELVGTKAPKKAPQGVAVREIG